MLPYKQEVAGSSPALPTISSRFNDIPEVRRYQPGFDLLSRDAQVSWFDGFNKERKYKLDI
jgi:hypothetical protein